MIVVAEIFGAARKGFGAKFEHAWEYMLMTALGKRRVAADRNEHKSELQPLIDLDIPVVSFGEIAQATFSSWNEN
ncbi:hypothetical protein [Paracoccus mutanolyticus]|uniref:hypothetical protein n=1 Tax=Paracoccus mutanolyticus TaxID=1499308 RepID=UPI0011AE4829|nr:hypothetical protein [Paracoccus mutanolyticus]